MRRGQYPTMTQGGQVVPKRSSNTGDNFKVSHSTDSECVSVRLEFKIPRELVERLSQGIVELSDKGHPTTACAVNTSSKIQNEDIEYQIHALSKRGFLRLKEVLAIIPVSRSTWYKGIASGRYPKPTRRFGPRIAAWDIEDIRALLEAGQNPRKSPAAHE